MRKLKIVKIQKLNRLGILFILLVLSPLSLLASAEFVPQLECGEYIFSGKLFTGQSQVSVLQMRSGTSTPYEYIVLGGDIEKRLSNMNTMTTIKARITKVNLETPFFRVQKILPYDPSISEYKLLSKKKCL
jgi:hypothetical protein